MKSNAFFHSLVLSLLLFASSLFAADRATIADLDAVLSRASSLHEFLGSGELQKAYLEMAQQYYGGAEKFPEETYQAILRSFKEALTTMPELADRAWSTRSVREPIILQSAIKAYGVKPKAEAWRKFLQSLGFDLSGSEKPVTIDEVRAKLQEIETEIEKIETDVSEKMSRRKRREFIASRYKELKESEVMASARSLVLKHLSAETAIRRKMESSYGDVALEMIDQIHHRTGEILPEMTQYPRAMRLALSAIPQAGTLADNRDLFVEDNSHEKIYGSEYRFIDLPRRFHALFRGIVHKECVGGDVRALNLLTPRRFLIPLLEGGHEVYILKDGRYLGYISTVAVDKGGKQFLSVDVMIGEMAKKVLVPGAGLERPFQRRPLFALWLDQESQRTKDEYEGYVVGQSFATDNAGGLYAIRTSGPWIEGSDAGESIDYRTRDPLEAKIVSLPKPEGLKANYDTGRMIYDLSVKDASRAVLLNPADFDDSVLDDPRWLKERFSGGLFTEAVTWVTFRYVRPDSAESRAALYDEAWLILKAINDETHNLHAVGLKFLENCGPVCMEGIFRSSFPVPVGSLKKFINGIDWVWAIPKDRRFNLVDDYLNRHLDRGIELAFQEKNPVDAVNEITKRFSDVPKRTRIIRAAIARARTAKEYLEISAPDVPNPTEAYLKGIAQVHDENFGKFLDFKPTNAELLELKGRLQTVAQTEKLAKAVIGRAKTISEMMPALSTEPFKRPSEDLMKIVDRLISDNTDSIFKLNPTVDDLIQLKGHTYFVETSGPILDRALSQVASLKEVFRLVEVYYGPNPSDAMKEVVGKIIVKHLDRFISFGPSISELLKLGPYIKTVDEYIAIMQTGLPLVRSADDYIELVTLSIKDPSEPMLRAAEQFIQDTIPAFQKVRPLIGNHWKRLQSLYPNADFKPPRIGLFRSCAELLTRPVY